MAEEKKDKLIDNAFLYFILIVYGFLFYYFFSLILEYVKQ